jgi:hypothetical protein
MKYLINNKWFDENGVDNLEITSGAGKKQTISITPKLPMSEKFLDKLYSMGRPYISLVSDIAVQKKAQEIKSKKIKINEFTKTKASDPEEIKEQSTDSISTPDTEQGE